MNREQHIKVDYLARMEGEGALDIVVSEGQIRSLAFRIWESPRFFEAFLVGRSYTELPNMTARICGICPVAYQMSSVHAAENAFGVRVEGSLRQLRRLLYAGEWMESHTLHIFLLAAPDFLGYESAIAMAADPRHREAVERGLRLKRLGNDIMAMLGGREIHPVSVCVGGFYAVPTSRAAFRDLIARLEQAREDAFWAIGWTTGLDLPDLTRDIEFVSLSHPDEYPMNEGRVVSSRGLNIPIEEFEEYFREEQVPYSNALQSSIWRRGAYFVGPLARVNLNFEKLSPDVQRAALDAGIRFPNSNPFTSIVARALEVAHCVEEALSIMQSYEPPPRPAVEVTPRRGEGFGLTEAPRGMLYHHYSFNEQGDIERANIVPPTAQNQRQIEEDLRAYVPQLLSLPLEEITLRCEMAVRNYDPCISCATHFLKVNIRHEP